MNAGDFEWYLSDSSFHYLEYIEAGEAAAADIKLEAAMAGLAE